MASSASGSSLQKGECVCCAEQCLSQLVDSSHSQWISVGKSSTKATVNWVIIHGVTLLATDGIP